MMKSVCVYLGANAGKEPCFKKAAIQLGKSIAKQGLRLIYGGSSHGLMGDLARVVIHHGGQVTGILPECLLGKETPLSTLDNLIMTNTMHERKMLMQEHADAFIVMPGGLGTLEEAFETWNAIKIGLINKPIGFLNVNHYYDTLLQFILHCETQGFVSAEQARIPLFHENPDHLLTELSK